MSEKTLTLDHEAVMETDQWEGYALTWPKMDNAIPTGQKVSAGHFATSDEALVAGEKKMTEIDGVGFSATKRTPH